MNDYISIKVVSVEYNRHFVRISLALAFLSFAAGFTCASFSQSETSAPAAELLEMSERLSVYNRQMRALMDINPNYIFCKAEDGRYLMANQAFADIFG